MHAVLSFDTVAGAAHSVQVAAPVLDENVVPVHGAHVLAPDTADVPAGHTVAHNAGVVELAAADVRPALQLTHALCSVAGCVWPAVHSEHRSEPTLAAKRPAPHGVQLLPATDV